MFVSLKCILLLPVFILKFLVSVIGHNEIESYLISPKILSF
jgi:hypothetical protein